MKNIHIDDLCVAKAAENSTHGQLFDNLDPTAMEQELSVILKECDKECNHLFNLFDSAENILDMYSCLAKPEREEMEGLLLQELCGNESVAALVSSPFENMNRIVLINALFGDTLNELTSNEAATIDTKKEEIDRTSSNVVTAGTMATMLPKKVTDKVVPKSVAKAANKVTKFIPKGKVLPKNAKFAAKMGNLVTRVIPGQLVIMIGIAAITALIVYARNLKEKTRVKYITRKNIPEEEFKEFKAQCFTKKEYQKRLKFLRQLKIQLDKYSLSKPDILFEDDLSTVFGNLGDLGKYILNPKSIATTMIGWFKSPSLEKYKMRQAGWMSNDRSTLVTESEVLYKEAQELELTKNMDKYANSIDRYILKHGVDDATTKALRSKLKVNLKLYKRAYRVYADMSKKMILSNYNVLAAK